MRLTASIHTIYEAMGTIAVAAHANGDTIDRGIRPKDEFNLQHGFEIFHKSNYMSTGKAPGEQRFEITSGYIFRNVLKQNYSESEIAPRANVDLDSLSPDKRQQAIQAVLEADLQ